MFFFFLVFFSPPYGKFVEFFTCTIRNINDSSKEIRYLSKQKMWKKVELELSCGTPAKREFKNSLHGFQADGGCDS